MIPKNREPTRPGVMLVEEFLKPMDMTQTALAEKLEVHAPVVSEIVNGRRAITPEMAVKLSRVLGTTSKFWMNLQVNVDLYRAERKVREHA